MNKQEFLNRFYHLRLTQSEPDYPLPAPGKPAAVLIPLINHNKQLNVLFTLRARHLKHHGGQISFPGGKQEPIDYDLIDTALRETEEEIGLNRNHIEIIGQLTRYRTVSRYEVTPYIGLVDSPQELILDPNEVDEVFEVPLAHLMEQQNHRIHWVQRHGLNYPIYFIQWQDKNIWGATAAFVRNLSHLIK